MCACACTARRATRAHATPDTRHQGGIEREGWHSRFSWFGPPQPSLAFVARPKNNRHSRTESKQQ